MLRGVIFDFGSTLIFFRGDILAIRPQAHRALFEALAAEGVELRKKSFLERFDRKFDEYDRRRSVDHLETTSAAVLLETLREEGLPAQPPERIRRALRAMYRVLEAQWELFPDTLETLRQLRTLKLRISLLSNASDEANVLQMLKDHRLEKKFNPVIISAAIGFRKPDSRSFQPVLDAWKIPPQQLVMVGDQLGMDVLGAQKLGMRTIWLRTEENSPTNRSFYGRVFADAQVRTLAEAGALIAHWREKEKA